MDYIEFEEIILALQESCERVDVLSDVTDCDLFLDITDPLLDQVIGLLEHIFNDKESSWISYWMFDLDFGNQYVPGDIPLKTIQDLYNILTES